VNLSIKHQLWAIVLSSVLITAVIMIVESSWTLKTLSQEHIQNFEESSYAKTKQALSDQTQVAMSILQAYYERASKDKIESEVRDYITEQSDFLFSIINKKYELYKDKLSEPELKKVIAEIVSATRYGEAGYFWINDFDYKMVMHPIKTELTGGYFKDNPKVPFVALAVEA